MPLAMQGEAGLSRNWTLAVAAAVLAALTLRWWLFAPFDISHADEIMQYLEQARRLATGHGIVPWEYRFGARNSLIPQVLALPWWLGERVASGSLVPMLAARWAFVALTLIALPAAWKLGALTSRNHALLALLAVGLWWESALYSNLLLSEGLGAALVLAGAALLLDEARRPATLRWAGLLLGLAMIVRLQYAPAVAALTIAAVRLDWKAWRDLVLGGFVAAAIGTVSDLAAGRIPFAWIWVNVQFNMVENRAARFGANGPFDYFTWLPQHLGPLAVLIVVAALFVPARYRPLLWAAAANLLFHSLITHKEYRFVWLTTLVLLVLGAIGTVSVVQRMLERRGRTFGPRHLALLAAAWIAASLLANTTSGGPRAYRGGSPIPLAALDGVKRGGVCGIALPNQWRAHLVPALLPGEVPLYVADAGVMDKGAPLPSELAAAANALVFESLPAGATGYREVSCKDNGAVRACLYLREGGCTPSGHWSYQQVLEREAL